MTLPTITTRSAYQSLKSYTGALVESAQRNLEGMWGEFSKILNCDLPWLNSDQYQIDAAYKELLGLSILERDKFDPLDQWLCKILRTAAGFRSNQEEDKAKIIDAKKLLAQVGFSNSYALLHLGYKMALRNSLNLEGSNPLAAKNAVSLFEKQLRLFIVTHYQQFQLLHPSFQTKPLFKKSDVNHGFITQLEAIHAKETRTTQMIVGAIAGTIAAAAGTYFLYQHQFAPIAANDLQIGSKFVKPVLPQSHAHSSDSLSPTEFDFLQEDIHKKLKTDPRASSTDYISNNNTLDYAIEAEPIVLESAAEAFNNLNQHDKPVSSLNFEVLESTHEVLKDRKNEDQSAGSLNKSSTADASTCINTVTSDPQDDSAIVPQSEVQGAKLDDMGDSPEAPEQAYSVPPQEYSSEPNDKTSSNPKYLATAALICTFAWIMTNRNRNKSKSSSQDPGAMFTSHLINPPILNPASLAPSTFTSRWISGSDDSKTEATCDLDAEDSDVESDLDTSIAALNEGDEFEIRFQPENVLFSSLEEFMNNVRQIKEENDRSNGAISFSPRSGLVYSLENPGILSPPRTMITTLAVTPLFERGAGAKSTESALEKLNLVINALVQSGTPEGKMFETVKELANGLFLQITKDLRNAYKIMQPLAQKELSANATGTTNQPINNEVLLNFFRRINRKMERLEKLHQFINDFLKPFALEVELQETLVSPIPKPSFAKTPVKTPGKALGAISPPGRISPLRTTSPLLARLNSPQPARSFPQVDSTALVVVPEDSIPPAPGFSLVETKIPEPLGLTNVPSPPRVLSAPPIIEAPDLMAPPPPTSDSFLEPEIALYSVADWTRNLSKPELNAIEEIIDPAELLSLSDPDRAAFVQANKNFAWNHWETQKKKQFGQIVERSNPQIFYKGLNVTETDKQIKEQIEAWEAQTKAIEKLVAEQKISATETQSIIDKGKSNIESLKRKLKNEPDVKDLKDIEELLTKYTTDELTILLFAYYSRFDQHFSDTNGADMKSDHPPLKESESPIAEVRKGIPNAVKTLIKNFPKTKEHMEKLKGEASDYKDKNQIVLRYFSRHFYLESEHLESMIQFIGGAGGRLTSLENIWIERTTKKTTKSGLNPLTHKPYLPSAEPQLPLYKKSKGDKKPSLALASGSAMAIFSPDAIKTVVLRRTTGRQKRKSLQPSVVDTSQTEFKSPFFHPTSSRGNASLTTKFKGKAVYTSQMINANEIDADHFMGNFVQALSKELILLKKQIAVLVSNVGREESSESDLFDLRGDALKQLEGSTNSNDLKTHVKLKFLSDQYAKVDKDKCSSTTDLSNSIVLGKYKPVAQCFVEQIKERKKQVNTQEIVELSGRIISFFNCLPYFLEKTSEPTPGAVSSHGTDDKSTDQKSDINSTTRFSAKKTRKAKGKNARPSLAPSASEMKKPESASTYVKVANDWYTNADFKGMPDLIKRYRQDLKKFIEQCDLSPEKPSIDIMETLGLH